MVGLALTRVASAPPPTSVGVVRADADRSVAGAAWLWVLDHVRDVEGPWLPESVVDGWEDAGPEEDRDSLYAGIAGLGPVLAEIAQSRRLSEIERALATRITERLSAMALMRLEPSLYDGLAGDATALRMRSPGHVPEALRRLIGLMTSDGWATTARLDAPTAYLSDVVMGTAGVVMAATWLGGEEAETIALNGGEALLRAGDRTAAGLDWGWWPGAPSRGPNYSHGTAGIRGARALAGAELLPRHRGHRECARRRGSELRAGRLRAGGRPRSAASPQRGVVGGWRLRRAAHDPAPPARGRAGHLHLVPRSDGDVAPVRFPGSRRRHRGRR